MSILKKLFWILVSLLGALALGTIASARGEHLNAVWLVVAAALVEALERLDLRFPKVGRAQLEEMQRIRAALEQEPSD